MHGPNLYPEHPADLGPCINEWFKQMSKLGHTLLSGIALALGMPENWFAISIAQNPTELFRIFHYPPSDISQLKEGEHPGWGVGIHTDYGLITILA